MNSRLKNPQVKVLSVDQTVNNSTTLVNSLLSFTNLPAGMYNFHLMVICTSSAVADFKSKINVQGDDGVTINGKLTNVVTTTVDLETNHVISTTTATEAIYRVGYVDMQAGGSIIIQFAQNTAEVSDTKFKKGSSLTLYKVTP